MKKVQSMDEYIKILRVYRQGKEKCSTNKMFMREELDTLIREGKLNYEVMEGVLWFLIDEEYFYSASFYIPDNTSIKMRPHNLDVVVELMGNAARYNNKWENELMKAGYEKYDKYFEYAANIEPMITNVVKNNENMRAYIEAIGCHYRKGTKEDYLEMRELWDAQLGRDTYTLHTISDARLEEMEKHSRCGLVCDGNGKICATQLYIKKNKTALLYHLATSNIGSGLGAAVYYGQIENAYNEGCEKIVGWVREDNEKSKSLLKQDMKETGKFFQQFVLRKIV